KKFYSFMPDDIRDRIDQMRNRFDFVTPMRQLESPFLSALMKAAINQKVLFIEYESKKGKNSREIQTIGIYASYCLWYCPAYCYILNDFRFFRCDIVLTLRNSSNTKPIDLQNVYVGNWESFIKEEQENVELYVELSRIGVQRCEVEL